MRNRSHLGPRLTVLICTHNRASLLEKALDSLAAALRPEEWFVEVLVVLSACTDNTLDLLDRYGSRTPLHLRWVVEPIPGKSRALNRGIELIRSDFVCFVDDDHRVEVEYLKKTVQAVDQYPEAGLFSGRVIPDWDGSEPDWVHDDGPYAIRPAPIPFSDLGASSKEIDSSGPLPGGANLVVKRKVFDRVGTFAENLGPRGHDIVGGEDTDFLLRALKLGERLRYVPEIVQFHHVDLERLKLFYLISKSYQRSRVAALIRSKASKRLPLFAFRKILVNGFKVILSVSSRKRRYYLVRTAACLGEARGLLELRGFRTNSGHSGMAEPNSR